MGESKSGSAAKVDPRSRNRSDIPLPTNLTAPACLAVNDQARRHLGARLGAGGCWAPKVNSRRAVHCDTLGFMRRGIERLSVLAVAGFCLAASPRLSAVVSYADVAPIFYKRCATCHHPDDIAPMALLTYKQTRPWAAAIGEAVLTRQMPPWKADPKYGKWANVWGLSSDEIASVKAWVDRGGAERPQPDARASRIHFRLAHRKARRGHFHSAAFTSPPMDRTNMSTSRCPRILRKTNGS
jgi:hypothetical protein